MHLHAGKDYNDFCPAEVRVRKAVGLGASGVVNMQITQALFWLAFGISVLAAPLATWLISPSWRYCLASFACTAVVVGGGLRLLDSWLVAKKAEQDTINQSRLPSQTAAPSPSVPIIKTPAPLIQASHPPKPQQDNSVHIEKGAMVEQTSKGPCSPNIIGGSNTVNCETTPPCPWQALTDKDYIRIASKVAGNNATVYIAMRPSDDDAAKFAGYMASALDHYGHWDTSNFEEAHGSFWTLHPGITVIAKDSSAFDDKDSAASRLKTAIESVGLSVHKKPVPTLSNDVGLWVGKCELPAQP
jgi:hypothetical protein